MTFRPILRSWTVVCGAMVCVLSGLTGCSESEGNGKDPDPPCTGQLELEWGRRESGSFQRFAAAEKAEITLGFQGFRYIDSTMRVSGVEGTKGTFGFRIDVDGHDAYNQSADQAELVMGSDAALYAEDVLVFFNDIPTAEVVGRNAKITANAKVAGCVDSYEASVQLVDEENCLELEDGGLSCQDGGTL